MKKIISTLLITAIGLMAAETTISDKLFKDFKAGDSISNYEQLKKSQQFDCKVINIPLSNISKCYALPEKSTFGGEKDFITAISTINDKINTVVLIKTNQKNSLPSNVWDSVIKDNIKAYHVFNPATEEMPLKNKLKNSTDVVSKNSQLKNKFYLEKKPFSISTVLVDTPNKVGSNFDFKEILTNTPEKMVRLIDVMEVFDTTKDEWLYRIDITNVSYQSYLKEEYYKINGNESSGL